MTTLIWFVIGSAGFYAVTMLLMKFWGSIPPMAMMAMIAVAFASGAWCEIEALKIERLSVIYIAILGVECLLIALASFAVLGESVTLREAMGGMLVIAGVALAATA